MKFFDKKENNMGQPEQPVPPPAQPAPKPAEVKYQPPASAPAPAPAPAPAQKRGSNTIIGPNLTIRGDISADENITIEGTVEGTIESTNDVIVAPAGKVRADIRANTITISGRVKGNISATHKVDLTSTGQLEGNIQAPKLAIAESAMFKGSIDMSPPGQGAKAAQRVQPESELVKK
ncbi:polymer-forming cytoskeletal protein [bacterium]|nr:polymer-forming cytoskeletal protein [bacterium]MCI0612903.1 polymer-forming cytoskeletal protein [bacterium]